MQSYKLPNVIKSNDLNQVDEIIDTYFQVYVKAHLEGLFAATNNKSEVTAILELLRMAVFMDSSNYKIKVLEAYPSSSDMVTIFVMIRRLLMGELSDNDRIIIHLKKMNTFNEDVSLNDLCPRISSIMVRLIHEFINAKYPVKNKENTNSPTPDSPGRTKPTASSPILIHDPRLYRTRSFLGSSSPLGGSSSPRLIDDVCRSPSSRKEHRP